jgi:serine/threonine protein kinase
MNQERIIIRPQDTQAVKLPGTTSLPDGKRPIKLGSGVISSLISSGGMAIVYEIWNQELEIRRAVKLLKPDHSLESEERFHTEMKISAKLHHPNIVEIYSVGNWNNLPYIEMELIEGVTLEKLIEDSGGLPPEVCTSLGIMVGRALNYAHNQNYVLYGKRYQGLIHRDLKPGNIMVDKDGVAKLMDFGIARPMTASIHTLEGAVMGTMQYLAPEQLDGKDVDVRADLYSLGAVLYEMITGTRAFPEEKLGKLVTDKLNNDYVPLTEFSARIPSSLCGLIHHCIRYEKEKRIQDSLEFLRAICRVHKTLTLKAPEQVLQRFLSGKRKEKHVIHLRKRSLVVPAIIWSITALALLATGTFAWLHVSNPGVTQQAIGKLSAFVRPLTTSIVSAPSIENDAEKADEGARVDSMLSLQKVKRNNRNEPLAALPDSTTITRVFDSLEADRQSTTARVQEETTVSPAEKSSQRFSSTHARLRAFPGKLARVGGKQTLLNSLTKQLDTYDQASKFYAEVDAGHFANALSLYKTLPVNLAETRKTLLYKLRALSGIGDDYGIRRLLATSEVEDGEFYLEKARRFYDSRDFATASRLVERAAAIPACFLDSRVFQERLLYVRALCASAVCDAGPDASTRKSAINAWMDVKSLLSATPDHKYFAKADSEIRRLNESVASR